ncbi:hypothetical protein LO763_02945 [Glycomyces sp. A-F 0318]|nr:hypothetical protein [Glycomyces amatae]MCD0442581.1 hypothetical protein [Glycomyces amatae]
MGRQVRRGQVREAGPGPEEPGAQERVQEARGEGVARAHGVLDAGRAGRDLGLAVCVDRIGAVRAEREDHQVRAGAGPSAGDRAGVLARVEPGQVLVADLDEVRAGRVALDAVALGAAVAQEHRPDVGVVGDRGPERGGPVDEAVDERGARSDRRGERSGVDAAAVGGQLGRARGVPGEVEAVVGAPVRADRGQCQAGAVGGGREALEVDAVAAQVVADDPPGQVVGEAGGEGDGVAEPGQADGHVGRTAAGTGRELRRVAVRDQVEQGFADNGDHRVPPKNA